MKVKAHPRQPDWLLAKVRRRACEEADAATNPWCAYDLFVSQARGPGPPPARASRIAPLALTRPRLYPQAPCTYCACSIFETLARRLFMQFARLTRCGTWH